MSTPASLHITHGGETKSFEQRCDGYPTFVMRTLVRWIATGGANKIHGLQHNAEALNRSHLCGYSRELRESEGKSLHLNPYHWNEVATRCGEWSYLIDLDKNTIKVFENAGEIDVFDLEGPGTDPVTYVKVLIPEAKSVEAKTIREAMDTLTQAGFVIN